MHKGIRLFQHKVISLAQIFILTLGIMILPTGTVKAELTNGHIVLDFVAEQLLAYGWAASSTVTLSIDNPSTGTGEDYTETVVTSSDITPVATFTWPTTVIEQGATLTVSGGGDSLQLINNLIIVETNRLHGTISGTGPASASLVVSILVGGRTDRTTTIGGDGSWLVDFHVKGADPYVFQTGSSSYPEGWAESIDASGNKIKVIIPAADPIITLRFSNPTNIVGSTNWPENTHLTLTIDDPINGVGVDYTETTTTDNNYRGSFLNMVDFALAVGQEVTVSDGTTILSMVVPKQYIRLMDPDTDLVCGVAEPGSEVLSSVNVGTYPNSTTIYQYEIADQQGDWCFDYSSPSDGIEVAEDMSLNIVQIDAQGNTISSWGPSTTFVDVYYIYKEVLGGTNYYMYSYIQALYDAGLTAGTSTDPARFSPKLNLDRSMAAVFMLRGNYGTLYNPPAAPWNTFTNESWANNVYAQKWAEGLFQAHLTAGCQTSPLRYCPDNILTREEAVVFALHLKYDTRDGDGNLISSYTPPAASGTVFADMTDPSHWGTKWAEQAYLDGILPACGTSGGIPLFCPNDPVDRAWAAYMIVKAKNIPLP